MSEFLRFEGISKSFAENKVLENVSFSVDRNALHAVIGENGAGKTTLMNILFELYTQDAGKIYLNSKPLSSSNPAKVAMVHQHFKLAENIIALDHILIDSDLPLLAPLNRGKKLDEINRFSEQLNMPVDWMKPVDSLPVGIQQRVEIIKALLKKPEILILDEPTAVLTPQESTFLYKQLLLLKKHGTTIIVVTHKLKEVIEFADTVTVLRKGKMINSGKVSTFTSETLGQLMIGRLPKHIPRKANAPSSEKLLEIKNFSYEKKLSNINLTLAKGEIVAVVGVEGNGQDELLAAITKPQTLRLQQVVGDLLYNDVNIKEKNTLYLRKNGMAIIPADRLHQAILPEKSATENFLLGKQFQFKMISLQKISIDCTDTMKNFDVHPLLPNLLMKNFSGGNQQKLVVGRELSGMPQLLIAAHPTRGVDIGAAEKIHEVLISATQAGAGILLVSADLDEVIKLANRIYVIFKGRLISELKNHNLSEDILGKHMGGVA